MIATAPFLKIVPVFAIALVSPGPDFMMISSLALSRGRLAGLLAAGGIAAGTAIYTTLCVFGLGVIFNHMHWLLLLVRICGGLYLIYLGVQLWRASFRPAPAGETKPVRLPGRNRNPFITGFLTNITNPKALAFFTSIFALALPTGASRPTQAAIIAVMGLMAAAWFGIVTFGLSAAPTRKLYLRCSRWIDRTAGTLLAAFGLRLLFWERN